MKKLIYISVALSTLFIGVFAYYFRPLVKPVSLCEIEQNAGLYQFNEVHIKAFLDVGKDGKFLNVFEIKKDCEDAGADLWFSENFEENLLEEKLTVEFRNLIEQLKGQSSENIMAVAEVEIVGKLVKREMHCFSLPYYVKVKEIKQTSPVKFINVSEEIQKIGTEK